MTYRVATIPPRPTAHIASDEFSPCSKPPLVVGEQHILDARMGLVKEWVQMPSEIDIYHSAKLLIDQHGGGRADLGGHAGGQVP